VRAAILALTAEEPMHGYQIIRELAERSGGRWSPSPGSVYPTLQMLEDEGLVVGEERDGKRVFAVTDAGRGVLSEREADRPAPWLEVGRGVDEALLGLRDLVGQVGAAVRQVAGSGTPDQVDRAKALLAETRRSLYRILAEDEGAASGPSES
jgi:DNA-binding PadR family transcriptional regulator